MPIVGDHQVGFGAESSVGTAVTPTRFLEVLDENVVLTIDRVESKALRVGRRVLDTSGWAAGNKDVTGDVTFEVRSAGFGLLFKHMLGKNTTTTPGGATNRRLHTAEVSGTDGLGLTTEIVRTDITGTKHAFTYSGCKIDNWSLTGALSDFLQLKVTLDGQNESVAASAGTTASYPTGIPYVFTGATVTLAGSSADVTGFTLNGDNGIAKERYFLGSGVKKEQVESSMRSYTGTFDVEWSGLTQYNRFINGTTASLVFKYETASAIEGSTKGSVTVTCPNVRFDGVTPVGGGQIVTQSVPFVALADSTDLTVSPVKIEYVSLDTTA